MTMQPLKLPAGVMRSATPALSRGRYYDTSLVRWRSGALLPVGGWERITPSPLPRPARRLHAWRDLKDISRIAIANDDGMQLLEGATYTNITPSGFTAIPPLSNVGGYGIGNYNADTYGTQRAAVDARLYTRPNMWSVDNFGALLVAVASSDGRLLQWDATATPLPAAMTPIAGAPVSNRAVVVTEERHLMLFGAGGIPYRVAWSSREAPSDWDFSGVTNTAGFFDLGISGWIVAAVKVRGGVLVFTDADVWLCRYVGQPFIYSFERIGEGCSLFSPYSVATFSGGAVWMGRESFWLFDGGSVRPLPCDVADYLYKQVDPNFGASRVFAAANGLHPEIWIFYPSADQTECDRYVVWSWAENWWALGQLQRSAMLTAGVSPYPVMSGIEGHLYQHERGWKAAGLPRTGMIFAETGPLAVENGGRTYSVVQAQLDTAAGFGGSAFKAFCQYTPDGQEFTEGPFYPRPDGWLDMRFSARDARLRIEAMEDREWSIGELRLDLNVGGRR